MMHPYFKYSARGLGKGRNKKEKVKKRHETERRKRRGKPGRRGTTQPVKSLKTHCLVPKATFHGQYTDLPTATGGKRGKPSKRRVSARNGREMPGSDVQFVIVLQQEGPVARVDPLAQGGVGFDGEDLVLGGFWGRLRFALLSHGRRTCAFSCVKRGGREI